MRVRRFLAAFLLVSALSGCDRNVEPFVPGEEPRQPDLSKIFPAGAEPAPEAPQMPSPAGGRGAPPIAADAAAGAPIEGTVVLAAELAGRVPAGAILFVIARTGAAGPPTAVKRIASPRFPVAFSIGPDDRMIQAMPFEGPFTVTARVDADGNAVTRTPGDLQGVVPTPLAPGSRGVVVTIDEVL